MFEKKTNVLDSTVVLCHNIGPDWPPNRILTDPYRLSTFSKLNAWAASILYKNGITKSLILSTGQTSGVDSPTESYATYEYMSKKWNIPGQNIYLETRSFDTSGNLKHSSEICAKHGFTNLGLLSIGSHSKNAYGLSGRYGLNFKRVFATEDVIYHHLKSVSPENALIFMEDFKYYNLLSGNLAYEAFRDFFLNTFDPNGSILRNLAQWQRRR